MIPEWLEEAEIEGWGQHGDRLINKHLISSMGVSKVGMSSGKPVWSGWFTLAAHSERQYLMVVHPTEGEAWESLLRFCAVDW